ncbi:trehalose-phosphatase [Rhodoblastus sp.]|uniref:trehalose-phosphatase n=1 Tax=Rhodoblastus sp. TaxID=1962975 RepID=UPI003F9971F6
MESAIPFDDIFGDVRNLALFLDLDGTLIDIAPTPSGALPPAELAGLLRSLSLGLQGAVAILSGRTIAAIDGLLAPLQLRAAGAHGSEIRDDEAGAIRDVAPALTPAFIEEVRSLADLDPGVWVEPKGAALAVHYRLAEHCGPEVERRLRAMLPAALEVRPGRMVVELVDRNTSKGAALQGFMRRPPFDGRQPVMIGDDVGDLAAFAAAEDLGGRGLRVGGEFFDSNAAEFSGPAEVRRWLAQLADRISSAQGSGGASFSSTPPWIPL